VVKCNEELQCSDGTSNKVSNIIRRHTDNRKLLLICILLISHSLIFFRFYFLSICGCIPVSNCNLCIFIVMSMYSYCSATLTEVFLCFFLSFKANSRVYLAKTGHRLHASKLFVLFYVLFVLCHSVYWLCVNVYCTTATGWQPNCS